jgi:hypothetical protein
MPVIDLVAAPAQEVANHVLARPFGAARGGYRDEVLCRSELRVEARIDGIENSLFDVAFDHRFDISREAFSLLPDQSTLCGHLPRPDRFQNRGGIPRLGCEILRRVEA